MNASRFPVPDDVSLDPDDGSVDTKTVGIKKKLYSGQLLLLVIHYE